VLPLEVNREFDQKSKTRRRGFALHLDQAKYSRIYRATGTTAAMTFTFTLQADYTRRKSIWVQQLPLAPDQVTPEAVTHSGRLKSSIAYAISSDSWRHTRNCRRLQRPGRRSTILEAEAR